MKFSPKNFDAYYVIICSRGPGSETNTLRRVPEDDKWSFTKSSKEDFQRFGACIGTADWADEGFLVCVPAGTWPLQGIFRCLLKDMANFFMSSGTKRTGVLRAVHGDFATAFRKTTWILAPKADPAKKSAEVAKDGAKYMEGTTSDYNLAYLSSLLRLFLWGQPNENSDLWTSVNGWRNVMLEVMNRPQFELLVNTMGVTYEDIARWDCAVIQKTLELARKGELSRRPAKGC